MPLPIRYVDEIFNADVLFGRIMGLYAQISKRTDNPITYSDKIIETDNPLLHAFLRVADVITKEEQRVLSALLDEMKRMSNTKSGKISDVRLRAEMYLVEGWAHQAEKIFNAGGNMYDLLFFTNPEYLKQNETTTGKFAFHGEIKDNDNLERFDVDGRWGLRDKTSKEIIIPAQYDYVGHCRYAYRGWDIKQDGQCGKVNARGEWIFPIEYDEIETVYSMGHILIKSGKKSAWNMNGIMIADFIYDDIDNSGDYENWKVCIEGKWGMIDSAGNDMIPVVYDELYSHKDYIHAQKDGLHGMIDAQNNIVIPFLYEEVDIRDKKVIVKKNGLYGIMTIDGEVRVPYQYEAYSVISNDIIRVKKDGLYGHINYDGNTVFPFKYEDLGTFAHYRDNITYAKCDGKYGFVDRDGKVIIPFDYYAANDFEREYAVVSSSPYHEGVIDKDNKIIVPLEYSDVHFVDYDVVEVRNINYKYGAFDLLNGYHLPCIYERIENYSRGHDGIVSCYCWTLRAKEPTAMLVNAEDSSFQRFCERITEQVEDKVKEYHPYPVSYGTAYDIVRDKYMLSIHIDVHSDIYPKWLLCSQKQRLNRELGILERDNDALARFFKPFEQEYHRVKNEVYTLNRFESYVRDILMDTTMRSLMNNFGG